MDKFEYYNFIKENLNKANFRVEDYKEINFGLQFNFIVESDKYLIRVYESKKGIKVDLSQIKNKTIADLFNKILNKKNNKNGISESDGYISDQELDSLVDLIGVDESGKGDYFGPLVIAGVYVDSNVSRLFRGIGVKDSKRLSDSRIKIISKDVKDLSVYSIVTIGNKKYNELYKKIGNLNKLLAWGHARCIENILLEVNAKTALSDKFGDQKLVKNALLKNGKKIELKQSTKAERNIAVAAASILARSEFVERLVRLSKTYNIIFPKGSSIEAVNVGCKFVQQSGKDQLQDVAKMHFKTTEKIIIPK